MPFTFNYNFHNINQHYIMGKVNPERKMFMDTIKDMREMVRKHYGSYSRDTMGLNKKNTKVPYTHLMGRR